MAYIYRVSYDETPMLLRVHYKEGGREKELSKVFVVEGSWAALYKKQPIPEEDYQAADFLVLRGACSPALRCTTQTTAAAVVQVLASTYDATPKARRLFPVCIRLAETDAAPSNLKAEALLQAAANANTDDQAPVSPVSLLHALCNCHRLHRAAQLSWAREPDIISGITRLCLVMSGAGTMTKLNRSIDAMVDSRLAVIHNMELSPAAHAYREALIPLILFPISKPRRRAEMLVIFRRVLNGDWRKTECIQHICEAGCCADERESSTKVKAALQVVCRIVRPGIFARNDWACWEDSWRFLTFGCGCHMLLPTLFALSFAEDIVAVPEEDCDGAPVRDAEAAPAQLEAGVLAALQQLTGAEVDNIQATRSITRLQRAAHLQGALTFLHHSQRWWRTYLLMRVVLQGEIALMDRVLQSTSNAACLRTMKDGLDSAKWQSFIMEAQSGQLTQALYMHFSHLLFSASLWDDLHFIETEHFRTSLARASSLQAAAIWEKLTFPFSIFPWKLFKMLRRDSDEHDANDILGAAPCVRGDFVNSLLLTYDSAQKLVSEEFKQVLALICSLCQGCTYATERLHSKNLRRSRLRTAAPRTALSVLALCHTGYSGPSWARHLRVRAPAGVAKKRGRPSKPVTGVKGSMGRPRKKQKHVGKRGGGGAWRSFLHANLKGLFNRDLMQRLRRDYLQLSDEERALHVSQGRLGVPICVAQENRQLLNVGSALYSASTLESTVYTESTESTLH